MKFRKFNMTNFQSNDLGRMAGSFRSNLLGAAKGNVKDHEFVKWVVELAADRAGVRVDQFWHAMQSKDAIRHLYNITVRKNKDVEDAQVITYEKYADRVRSGWDFALSLRDISRNVRVDKTAEKEAA